MTLERHFVEYRDGKHYAYRTTDGRDRIRVGPGWLTPRDAIAYAKQQDALHPISPLRSGLDDLASSSEQSGDRLPR